MFSPTFIFTIVLQFSTRYFFYLLCYQYRKKCTFMLSIWKEMYFHAINMERNVLSCYQYGKKCTFMLSIWKEMYKCYWHLYKHTHLTLVSRSTALRSNSVMTFLTPACARRPLLVTMGTESSTDSILIDMVWVARLVPSDTWNLNPSCRSSLALVWTYFTNPLLMSDWRNSTMALPGDKRK